MSQCFLKSFTISIWTCFGWLQYQPSLIGAGEVQSNNRTIRFTCGCGATQDSGNIGNTICSQILQHDEQRREETKRYRLLQQFGQGALECAKAIRRAHGVHFPHRPHGVPRCWERTNRLGRRFGHGRWSGHQFTSTIRSLRSHERVLGEWRRGPRQSRLPCGQSGPSPWCTERFTGE